MITYLVCDHCKCEFAASFKQGKRLAASLPGQLYYCSALCRRAAQAARRLVHPFSGTCVTCKKDFTYRFPSKRKSYCSMACYIADPKMRERIALLSVKAREVACLKLTGLPPQPRVEVTCMHCGIKWTAKVSEKRKFCSRRCYRRYMAERFDRWVNSPQAIALPQCYDEFLTQEELPCLIEGCTWVGRHLSTHVNRAHGIQCDEFKRAAGFNSKTGLVTPDVSEMLASRPHLQGIAATSASTRFPLNNKVRPVRNYISRESHEHRVKARALAGMVSVPTRVCRMCGAEYAPALGAWGSLYCTVKCRTAYYENKGRTPMTCGTCSKNFVASKSQRNNSIRLGRPVFCSHSCKGIRNGSFPKPGNRNKPVPAEPQADKCLA